MARVHLKGLHRVRRKLASGAYSEHHYAWRGGPKIWDSESPFTIGSPEYISAFTNATKSPLDKAVKRFRTIIIKFQKSSSFTELAPRTQEDYKRWLPKVDAKFGDAPIAAFENIKIRGIALDWRDNWQGRQAAQAWTTLCKVVKFANERRIILNYHFRDAPKVYQVDRSEIIWTRSDIAEFSAVAPDYAKRALILATETGLRPGDLIRLSKGHIEHTPEGRRISIRTNKRKKIAVIPVTPTCAEIIDATPDDRMLILFNDKGKPWTVGAVSKSVKKFARKAGLDESLRLYDARGTACTKLLNANCTLQQIALIMGWSLKTAAKQIESYAHLDSDITDNVLTLLSKHKTGVKV